MAEPKKDFKKPDSKGGGKPGGDKKPADKGGGAPNFGGDIETGVFILLILAVAFTVFYGILRSFGISDGNSYLGQKWTAFTAWAAHFLVQSINALTFLSIFSSIMFIMGAYYAKFRKKEIVEDMKYKDEQLMAQSGANSSGMVMKAGISGTNLFGTSNSGGSGLATVASVGTEQWRGIERYMQSHNPSDWRLAIIEADILLYDMLEQIGFQGDTIGDKLKSVDPASFNTLDDAWRAHKVRNILAHEGSNYELTYDEARKTINYFKKVFDEFYFI